MTSCLVCPSRLSSRLPARLFLSLSRICHFKPIRIIWDEASYSFRSSSASIFTQIPLFSSKSNNAGTCIINVCLDTPCMLPVEFVHVNEVQNRDCDLHFWVSCCVSQRRVWGWKNRKHKESHPVFGSCRLLPQGQHSWQEQGRHAGMVTPNTHTLESNQTLTSKGNAILYSTPLLPRRPCGSVLGISLLNNPPNVDLHRWVQSCLHWGVLWFHQFFPAFSLYLSSPSFLPALVSPHSLLSPAGSDGWL